MAKVGFVVMLVFVALFLAANLSVGAPANLSVGAPAIQSQAEEARNDQ